MAWCIFSCPWILTSVLVGQDRTVMLCGRNLTSGHWEPCFRGKTVLLPKFCPNVVKCTSLWSISLSYHANLKFARLSWWKLWHSTSMHLEVQSWGQHCIQKFSGLMQQQSHGQSSRWTLLGLTIPLLALGPSGLSMGNTGMGWVSESCRTKRMDLIQLEEETELSVALIQGVLLFLTQTKAWRLLKMSRI